ncbi:YrhA family protein [Metabacillus niabensis]|uniref:YrhA family protein n=1 Tax=Metabacillus niabensis TaxID=324854 RepID=UPI0039A08803
MWKEALAEVKKVTNQFNMKYNDGATEAELQKFKSEVKGKFGFELPQDYIHLLQEMNGFEFNGFIIYGVDEKFLDKKPKQRLTGFIELSEFWYENEHQKQYIFIGESNITWYVYDLQSYKYIELDNPGGEEMHYYDTFDEIITKLLTDSIL